uniref:Uncharacterized protein n=1 Tax=Panagrolaimus superbus TaxID=310955 RepID=A0A914Z409_9BILA
MEKFAESPDFNSEYEPEVGSKKKKLIVKPPPPIKRFTSNDEEEESSKYNTEYEKTTPPPPSELSSAPGIKYITWQQEPLHVHISNDDVTPMALEPSFPKLFDLQASTAFIPSGEQTDNMNNETMHGMGTDLSCSTKSDSDSMMSPELLVGAYYLSVALAAPKPREESDDEEKDAAPLPPHDESAVADSLHYVNAQVIKVEYQGIFGKDAVEDFMKSARDIEVRQNIVVAVEADETYVQTLKSCCSHRKWKRAMCWNIAKCIGSTRYNTACYVKFMKKVLNLDISKPGTEAVFAKKPFFCFYCEYYNETANGNSGGINGGNGGGQDGGTGKNGEKNDSGNGGGNAGEGNARGKAGCLNAYDENGEQPENPGPYAWIAEEYDLSGYY